MAEPVRVDAAETASRPPERGDEAPQLRLERRLLDGSRYWINTLVCAGPGVTTTYAYDIENRLVSVVTPMDTWEYRYDSFGNRVGATHNGVGTTYVVDPTG